MRFQHPQQRFGGRGRVVIVISVFITFFFIIIIIVVVIVVVVSDASAAGGVADDIPRQGHRQHPGVGSELQGCWFGAGASAGMPSIVQLPPTDTYRNGECGPATWRSVFASILLVPRCSHRKWELCRRLRHTISVAAELNRVKSSYRDLMSRLRRIMSFATTRNPSTSMATSYSANCHRSLRVSVVEIGNASAKGLQERGVDGAAHEPEPP